MPIGIPELVIVLVILLVIFGPKRLPGLGRSLGSGMREFKDSISGGGKSDEDDDDERPALTRSTTQPPEQRPAGEPLAQREEPAADRRA